MEAASVNTSDRVLKYLREVAPFRPTMREIQAALEISSVSVVGYHINKLEQQGFVSRPGNQKSRGVRVEPERPLLCMTLPWIPDQELRGNAREHYMARARHVAKLRYKGTEYGLRAKTERPDVEYPIQGPLSLEITGWNTKQVDWENLAYGFKALIDGLQVAVKRDAFGEVPGAGVIVDDKQIINATIKTRVGPPRSQIVLRRAADSVSE